MAYRRGPMAAGERDRIVTIQQRSAADVVDTSGAPTEEIQWTTLVSAMPVSRADLSHREPFGADQITARYDTRWEMNYRSDMDPELVDVPKLRRLLVFSRPLDIVGASVIGRRAGVELLTLGSTRAAS